MQKLKIYKIDDAYVAHLQTIDARVQDNKNRRRPYVGIVLSVSGFDYFVPMESPKSNHASIKPGNHLFFLDDGKCGLLGFNNMIPVPRSALIDFDIASVPDRKYRELLIHQASICNKNRDTIRNHATKTYDAVTSGKNKFLCRISCDFKKLEAACLQFVG